MQEKKLEIYRFQKDDRDSFLSLRNLISRPDGAYQTRFGGSDCGTILGLNKYKDPLRFFHECIGEAERAIIDNDFVETGHLFEEIVMKEYWQYYDPKNPDPSVLRHNRRTSNLVRRARNMNATAINPKYPWLFYSPDGLINKNGGTKEKLYEGKTAGREAVDSWEEGINPSYVAQVNQGMLVLELDEAELALLINGVHFHVFPFKKSKAICEAIIEKTRDFHERVCIIVDLKNRVAPNDEIKQAIHEYEPPVSDSPDYEAFLKERYKSENNKVFVANQEHFNLVQKWVSLQKESDVITSEIKQITNFLRKEMIDTDSNEMSFGDNKRITWKSNGFRINKKLKEFFN